MTISEGQKKVPSTAVQPMQNLNDKLQHREVDTTLAVFLVLFCNLRRHFLPQEPLFSTWNHASASFMYATLYASGKCRQAREPV